jgi:hypothetical protein
MVTEKRVLSVQVILVSVYVSCWFSSILFYFTNIEVINYIEISILGATVSMMAAVAIFAALYLYKWFGSIMMLLNFLLLVLISLSIIPNPLIFWLLLIFAGAQGLLLGTILQRNLSGPYLNQNLSLLPLGCLACALFLYFSGRIIGNNISGQTADNTLWNITYLSGIIILILTMTEFLGFKFIIEIKSEQKEINENSGLSKHIKCIAIILAAILLLIEIAFYFWCVVLIDDNQGLNSSLIFPLSIIAIFIFRLLAKKVLNKISNIGWLFALSIILTVSLGMFYTFNFISVFIFGFSFSIAYLISIHYRLFQVSINYKTMAYLLLLGSVSIIIAGLFIQNHIEFIRAINIPEAVVTLSARQALVKELASLAGVAVILSGYLFLKRRSLLSLSN